MRRVHLKSIIRVGVVLIILIMIVPALYHYIDAKEKGDDILRLHQRGDQQQDHQGNNQDVIKMNQEDEEYIPGRPIVVHKPELAAKLKHGVLGNYEPEEKKRQSGPGENGDAIFVDASEQSEAKRSINEYGFNIVASDKMAMDRTIPDTRLDECRYWQYPPPENLLTASVIVVFHNEAMSTLVRTIHSIINRSPDRLLKEIIMVDDFSDKPHLKEPLEKYLATKFSSKVKLFRNKHREGLIRTRTKGAEYAVGDVIIFLDAHCECNVNWLPPLLTRIAVDRSIMAVPIVDSINWDTMKYTHQYRETHYMGIFEWGYLYKEARVPKKELNRRKHHSEPFRSPTHAGGLFAMDRKYFFELGAYDSGLLIWGGENFELSFKIWQCGGKIEWVPCSRVGHIYRNHMPYSIGHVESKISPILLNYIRVVEVWMEEPFRSYFYTSQPNIEGYPPGNLTAQRELKQRYKCKNFQWFMDNVAYVVKEKFPYPPPNQVWGEVASADGHCWDTYSQGPHQGNFGLSGCHHYGGNQLFRLNTQGQMYVGERCVEKRYPGNVGMTYCPTGTSGPWKFDAESGQIRHKDGTCARGHNSELRMVTCDESDPKQKWKWKETKPWKKLI